MADAAPRGIAHPAGLAGRERREVVVVHEALRVLGREVVDPLRHARAGQRREAQHLRLAALEQARAVRARDQVDLRRQRPQVGVTATIGADAIVEDAAPHDPLLQRVEGVALRLVVGVVVEIVEQRRLDRSATSVAVGLVLRLAQRGNQVGADPFLDGRQHVGIDRLRRVRPLGRRDLRGQRLLHLADRGNRFLTQRQRLDQHRLRHFPSLGLDHRDRVLGPGHNQVQVRDLKLRKRRLEHQFAIDVPDPHRRHRAVEGNVGDAKRRRRRNRAQRVGRVLHVDREDRDDQLRVVVVALGKQRPDRPVGQPRREHGRRRRSPLAPEKRSGNPPRRVEPLLELHREREKIDPRSRLRGRRRTEHHRVAVAHGDGPAGLVRQLARLDRQGASGNLLLDGSRGDFHNCLCSCASPVLACRDLPVLVLPAAASSTTGFVCSAAIRRSRALAQRVADVGSRRFAALAGPNSRWTSGADPVR